MNSQGSYILCLNHILSWHLIWHSQEKGGIEGDTQGKYVFNGETLISHYRVPLRKGGVRKPLHSTISLSDGRGLSNLPKPLRIVKGSWRIVKPKVDSRLSGVVLPEVWETISYDMETHTGSQFARDLENIPQVSVIGGWRCCRIDSNRTTRHTGCRFARHLKNITQVSVKGGWRCCRIETIRLESNDSS